jgi:cytochrome P450
VSTLPGPKGGFFSKAASALRRDQLGFYEACAREYGDVAGLRAGPYRIRLIYHPDAIEEMLVTRARDFVKTPGVRRSLRPLLGEGLLLSEGDFWLRQRRLAQPAFHRQRVTGYGAVMTEFAERHVAAWRDGTVVELHGEMMAVTQAIVGKTLFDADVSGDAHEAAGCRRARTSRRAGPSAGWTRSSAASSASGARAARTAATCCRCWWRPRTPTTARG